MDVSATVKEIVGQPSARPIPDSIQAAGNFLAQKYGQAVQGILLYGSCLRAGTDENGLVDCYVIVDQYASVYQSTWLALLNRWLTAQRVLWGGGSRRANSAHEICGAVFGGF